MMSFRSTDERAAPAHISAQSESEPAERENKEPECQMSRIRSKHQCQIHCRSVGHQSIAVTILLSCLVATLSRIPSWGLGRRNWRRIAGRPIIRCRSPYSIFLDFPKLRILSIFILHISDNSRRVWSCKNKYSLDLHSPCDNSRRVWSRNKAAIMDRRERRDKLSAFLMAIVLFGIVTLGEAFVFRRTESVSSKGSKALGMVYQGDIFQDDGGDDGEIWGGDGDLDLPSESIDDLSWKVAKLRLEEANTKRFLKSGPRFLPYEECRNWVKAWNRWDTEEDWKNWIREGEKRNAYIPARPDEYYGRLGKWISWDHFLGKEAKVNEGCTEDTEDEKKESE